MLIKYALVDFSPGEVAFFQAAIRALAIAAPFILISTGGRSIPSGLAGVLLSTLPMFVALAVGVQAVGSLGQLLGALAVLGATASGAISNFVVKLQCRDKNVPPTTTTFSLTVGAVLVAPFAVITASGNAVTR